MVLRQAIEELCTRMQCDEIVYCTEWLGYMPCGVYHWIECAGETLTEAPDWVAADLQVLETQGFLQKLAQWQDPDDEFQTDTRYRVLRF